VFSEWITGVQGRIVLQDEDVTSKTEGDYKQLNTLQHYKVPDGAKVSLIPRQSSSSYNLSLLSDRSAYSHRYGKFSILMCIDFFIESLI
jgi:plexin A